MAILYSPIFVVLHFIYFKLKQLFIYAFVFTFRGLINPLPIILTHISINFTFRIMLKSVFVKNSICLMFKPFEG